MDIASQHAIQLLDALADARWALSELARPFGSSPESLAFCGNIECVRVEGRAPTLLSIHVDVQKPSARPYHLLSRTWWLEVFWDMEAWMVDCSITEIDEELRHVQVFPKREANTLEEVTAAIRAAVNDLVTSDHTVSFLAR